MSEPTYKIETFHEPHKAAVIQWGARITRLSDDGVVAFEYGETEGAAIANARMWIERINDTGIGRTIYVTEDGAIVPAPSTQSRMVPEAGAVAPSIESVRSQAPSSHHTDIATLLRTQPANTALYRRLGGA
jgi:hypothetical protein